MASDRLSGLAPRPPRKLRETVFTDGGLRLPPVAIIHRERWPWVVLALSPFAGLLVAGAIHYLPATIEERAARAAIENSVHYAGCGQVRLLGKAPLYSGQPGYNLEMDGDADGIACEPHSS